MKKQPSLEVVFILLVILVILEVAAYLYISRTANIRGRIHEQQKADISRDTDFIIITQRHV